MTALQSAQLVLLPSPRRSTQNLGVPSFPCSLRCCLTLFGTLLVRDHLSCRAFWPNAKQIS